MAVFTAAVESRSFAAAARTFRISATMVGKHVRALEARVGGQLLSRTTRTQGLTELGSAYYERCKQILREVESANAIAGELHSSAQGLLRVGAPVSFGAHRLVPLIGEYQALQPQVQLELSLSDERVDLVEAHLDVAIRVGPVSGANLIARRLPPYRMLVCASPAYLARHGTPRIPSELAQHNCLGFTPWRNRGSWRFTRGPETTTVSVSGTLRSNSGPALRQAALEGLGIVLQPEALLASDVTAGRLQRLLPGWTAPGRPMHLLRLKEAQPSRKVRTFVDFVVQRLEAEARARAD